MSARLLTPASQYMADFQAAVNGHGADLDSVAATLAGINLGRASNGFLAPTTTNATWAAGSNATPWATATSQSRVTIPGSTTTGTFVVAIGLVRLSSAQWIFVWATYTGAAYTLSAIGVSYVAGTGISFNTPALVFYGATGGASVATAALSVAGMVALSPNLARVTCAPNANYNIGAAAIVFGVSFANGTLFSVQYPSTTYLSALGSSGTYLNSSSPYAALCGQFSLAGAHAGVVSTSLGPAGPGCWAHHVEGPHVDHQVVDGARNGNVGLTNANLGAVTATYGAGSPFNGFGGHDYLGPLDVAGTQLMLTLAGGKQIGEPLRPAAQLWAVNDAGPRLVDRMSFPDGFFQTTAPSVWAIGPGLALVQWHNGASRTTAVLGVAVSATRGLYLALVVPPFCSGGSRSQVVGVHAYAPGLAYALTPATSGGAAQANGTAWALRQLAIPVTYPGAASTLTEGPVVAVATGADSTHTARGSVRLDADVVLLFGQTAQSTNTTSSTITLESFALT